MSENKERKDYWGVGIIIVSQIFPSPKPWNWQLRCFVGQKGIGIINKTKVFKRDKLFGNISIGPFYSYKFLKEEEGGRRLDRKDVPYKKPHPTRPAIAGFESQPVVKKCGQLRKQETDHNL